MLLFLPFSKDRAEPRSVCTANVTESIFPGGEVEFVRHMIADSLLLKNKIRLVELVFSLILSGTDYFQSVCAAQLTFSV